MVLQHSSPTASATFQLHCRKICTADLDLRYCVKDPLISLCYFKKFPRSKNELDGKSLKREAMGAFGSNMMLVLRFYN
jgi:hypothetical protein